MAKNNIPFKADHKKGENKLSQRFSLATSYLDKGCDVVRLYEKVY